MMTKGRLLATAAIALFVCLSVSTPAAAGSQVSARTPSLVSIKPTVRLSEDMVRLGDLFSGLTPDLAERPLIYAPTPGKKLVLDARYLMRVARAYRINWRPLSAADRIIVERASNPIEIEELVNLVASGLAQDGIEGELEVVLDQRDLVIHLPSHLAPYPQLERLEADPRTGRFVADVVAPPEHPESRRFSVSGRFHRLIPVPVLNRTVGTDEIIRGSDVDWIEMREDEVNRTVAVDLESVMGKTPRRPMRPHIPIRMGDLKEPELVRRKGPVIITFRSGNLELTARATALQSGAKGDIVRVMNMDSRKVIQAVVVGENAVEIINVDPATIARGRPR